MLDKPDPNKRAKRRVLSEITKHVSIRKTHPNLYISLMTIAVASIALGVNLHYFTPTFRPYGISEELIGACFSVLGLSQLIFLNLYHNLKLVRLVLAMSISFMLFWGLSNTQQSFAGKASFQLPILLITLAALQIPLLVEPSTNPMTSNKKKEVA